MEDFKARVTNFIMGIAYLAFYAAWFITRILPLLSRPFMYMSTLDFLFSLLFITFGALFAIISLFMVLEAIFPGKIIKP